MPTQHRVAEQLFLRHDAELPGQGRVEHRNVQCGEMIGGINHWPRGIDVLQPLGVHAHQTCIQDQSRPEAREPVLHTPAAVEQRRQQRQYSEHECVEIDERQVDEIRTQTSEERAPSLHATSDLMCPCVHRVMLSTPSWSWLRRQGRSSQLRQSLLPVYSARPRVPALRERSPLPREELPSAKLPATIRWWWRRADWQPASLSPARPEEARSR